VHETLKAETETFSPKTKIWAKLSETRPWVCLETVSRPRRRSDNIPSSNSSFSESKRPRRVGQVGFISDNIPKFLTEDDITESFVLQHNYSAPSAPI
jgi:hypothetical protein